MPESYRIILQSTTRGEQRFARFAYPLEIVKYILSGMLAVTSTLLCFCIIPVEQILSFPRQKYTGALEVAFWILLALRLLLSEAARRGLDSRPLLHRGGVRDTSQRRGESR